MDTNLTQTSQPAQKVTTPRHTSIDTGVIRHGEHLVDAILIQAGMRDPRILQAFENVTRQIAEACRLGEFPSSNEKIDGSTSITVGFTAKNWPFVSYKNDFLAKNQKLGSSFKNIFQRHPSGSPLRQLFSHALKVLRPRMQGNLGRNTILQGDVLFSPANPDRKVVTPDAVYIKANAIEYRIPKESELYERAKRTELAVVFHTLCDRQVDPQTKRISDIARNDPEELIKLCDALNNERVLVLHPWRPAQPIPVIDLTAELVSKLADIQQLLAPILISSDFQEAWNKDHLPKVRVYLNSLLHAGSKGGLDAACRNGEVFNFPKFLKGMHEWLEIRSSREVVIGTPSKRIYTKYREKFDQFLASDFGNFEAVMQAYFLALQINERLLKASRPVFNSKLGGGSLEGLMFRDTATSVVFKWIDRLDFTMLNHAINNRDKRLSSYPFDTWRAGAYFIPAKLQPMHAGHVAIIKKVCEQAKIENVSVYVVASNKAPKLCSKNWKGLGLADTKKKLAEGEFSHAFSLKLRERLIKHGLPENAELILVNPTQLWSYIAWAKETQQTGKIKLVLGEKDTENGRYEDQFNNFLDYLDVEEMKAELDGLSASSIREKIKLLTTGAEDSDALQALHEALGYIVNEKRRARFICQLVNEYKRCLNRANKVLQAK